MNRVLIYFLSILILPFMLSGITGSAYGESPQKARKAASNKPVESRKTAIRTQGDDPRNKVYPGEFKYGGGHVIQELVESKDVRLQGTAYGTDCYPRRQLDTLINLRGLNEAVLFNIRNCYQNYNVAVNLS